MTVFMVAACILLTTELDRTPDHSQGIHALAAGMIEEYPAESARSHQCAYSITQHGKTMLRLSETRS